MTIGLVEAPGSSSLVGQPSVIVFVLTREVAGMTRFKTVGFRKNVQFGDQFRYRWDRSETPDVDDLFMFVGQFGHGMVVTGLLADPAAFRSMVEEGENPKEWRCAPLLT